MSSKDDGALTHVKSCDSTELDRENVGENGMNNTERLSNRNVQVNAGTRIERSVSEVSIFLALKGIANLNLFLIRKVGNATFCLQFHEGMKFVLLLMIAD